MKPAAYLETSIIGYLAARPSRDLIIAAHQQLTSEWWENRRLKFDLYISEIVIQEAILGDSLAAQKRLQILEGLPLLALTQEAIELAQVLVSPNVIPESARVDALHISVATVHGMEYLLTWNCRHIANAEMRSRIERACRAQGYEPPIPCTPEELMGE